MAVPDLDQDGRLSDEALTYWRSEITRSRTTRDGVATRYDWQGNLDRYAPPDVVKVKGEVNVGADFSDVERKKAALLFARPNVSLACDDLQQPLTPPQPPVQGQPPPPPPTMGSLVAVHQELLNEVLGAGHIDVQPVALKCIFDMLCPAGVGAVKIGYHATTVQVEQPQPQMDPVTGQGMVDPVSGQPLTAPVMVDVPVHEEFFVTRISPKALLLPADWKDTDVRKAPWVGYEWQKPISQVRREYGLGPEWEGPRKAGSETPEFHANTVAATPADQGDPPVTGWTIEYRGLVRDLSPHPEVIYTLTMVDGDDTPLEHKPSPYQQIGQDARLTPASVRGFTLRTLTVRDLSDSAWVPSDCAVTGPLTREINLYRTQHVKQRDSARQIMVYDTDAFTTEQKDKIEKGDINTFVGVADLVGKGGVDNIIKQVGTAVLGREHFIGQDYMERDRERILGISANQSGAQNQGKRTATEITNVQRNSEARFEQERQRVIAWYLDVVRCVDALLLQFGDLRLAAPLLGQRKATLWAQFKGLLAGGYRYGMQIDSGKYLDVEGSRRQTVQFYQMTRQDPLINPKPTIEKLAVEFGIDPAEFLAPPKPPQPPPPQAAFSLKGEDLSPLSPQFPLAIKMAQQGGWQITPADIEAAKAHAAQLQQIAALLGAMQGAQPAAPGAPGQDVTHGGPATQVMPIQKRQEQETGGLANAPDAGQGLLQ